MDRTNKHKSHNAILRNVKVLTYWKRALGMEQIGVSTVSRSADDLSSVHTAWRHLMTTRVFLVAGTYNTLNIHVRHVIVSRG